MRTGIFEDEQFYICHDGRELRHLRTESKEQDGYTQTFEVYGCADCSGCEHKARCLYKYDAEKDAEKNKVMKINEQWEELKERSHANIQSERESFFAFSLSFVTSTSIASSYISLMISRLS